MPPDTVPVVELSAETFVQSINDQPLAIVDFWAPWCAPCRAFAPVFAAAAQRHRDALFAKLNTEEHPAVAAHFDIRSIPTLMVFRDNIIVYAEAGALPAGALDQVIAAARSLDMREVRRQIQARDAATPNASA
jgi:thioredoxin 1